MKNTTLIGALLLATTLCTAQAFAQMPPPSPAAPTGQPCYGTPDGTSIGPGVICVGGVGVPAAPVTPTVPNQIGTVGKNGQPVTNLLNTSGPADIIPIPPAPPGPFQFTDHTPHIPCTVSYLPPAGSNIDEPNDPNWLNYAYCTITDAHGNIWSTPCGEETCSSSICDQAEAACTAAQPTTGQYF